MALGVYNEALLRGASTSLDHIKNWLAGSVGSDSLPAKPRIDDLDRLTIDNEDTTSGNALSIVSTITSSNVVDISAAALNAGKAIDLSNLDAITTGKAIHIDATGVTQTDGILVHIDSASTALTSTGRLLLVDHTGASGVSTIISEFKSAATDETTIVKITATSTLISGVMLDISGAALTTGKVIDMSDLDAITTGKAIHVDATGITQTSGILVHIDSACTVMDYTGRLLLVDHTGATTTSGIVAEVASAANDETTVMRVTASAALALGVVLDLSAAAVTTGTVLDLGGLDALTTGKGINIVSNASGTGTRQLLFINNDNTAAVGTTCLEINNDATAGAHIKLTGTGILGIDFTALGSGDFLFDCTAGAGCTAAPQTNAATGFVRIKVSGTEQWFPYYNAT